MLLALLLAGPALSAADGRLQSLLEAAWEYRLREDPLLATAVGRHDYDDRINYAMLESQLRDLILEFEFNGHLIPITAESGFHTDFGRLPREMPFATARDYANYTARLRAFPRYVEQHIELMRRGIATGFVLPRVVLDGYESTIAPHPVDDVRQSVFWRPFVSFRESVSDGERPELEDLPGIRRFARIDAYGEGWALYAERLGVEAGLYDDPYDHFGRLTYEMWRACRLVVDTGLHAMGWSRERVVESLAAHTALSRHEIATETDRYISWPGQALSYKLGELKIRQLRREAEEALAGLFDVRDFHDVVLSQRPLPLLEDQVRAFIERRLDSAG